MKDQFLLDPSITYLNFGSFGACPKPVFRAYQEFQSELERGPVQFMVNTGLTSLKEARVRLASYLSCDSDDLVLMTNPSYGINTIVKSIPLNAGDEILTTNLEYGAMDRTWKYYCKKVGAIYRTVEFDFPILSKEEFLKTFWSGCTSKTKAVFISHMTSATALILPIEEICIEAKQRGIMTIIDGAHIPGQLPLNLKELDPDIYVGACHKWMMSPKGAAFLYVKKVHQGWVDPLLISWGYQSDTPSHSQFIDYHETTGTRDFSAFLAVPSAIDFMEEQDWNSKRLRCQQKTIYWAERLKATFGFEPIAPIDSTFIGQMFSMPIKTNDLVALKEVLFNRFGIEVPIFLNHQDAFIRFSYQVFNTDEDMEGLVKALKVLQKEKYFSIH